MTTSWLPNPVGLARLPQDLLGGVAGLDEALLGPWLWHGRAAADVALSPADRAWSAVVACGAHALLPEPRAEPPGGPAPSPAAGGTICLLAAAWIHTGGPPPTELDVAVPRPVRARFGPVRYRYVRISDRDVVTTGGIRVTTPLTTACDLARAVAHEGAAASRPVPTAPAADAVRGLLDAGVSRDAVRARLMTARRSNARLARTWLESL